MSSQNPFAVATPTSTTPVAAPVEQAPVAGAPLVAPVGEVPAVAGAEVAEGKVKKAKKPRQTNKKMEDADKIAIIKRYQTEDIGTIAASLGYTRSQAYNVVRNTRLLLEAELSENPNMDAARKQQIENTLKLVEGKEFGAGRTAGAAAKTTTDKVSDILSALLG